MAAESPSITNFFRKGSMLLNSSYQSIVENYASYVADNPQMITQVEKTVQALSYVIQYIPREYDNFIFVTELLNSANSLFTYVNDSILRRAAKFQLGEKESIHLVQLLERWISIVEFTQAFVEMTANRIGGKGARWAVIVVVSLVKATMRLVLLYGFKSGIQTHPLFKELNRETLLKARSDENANDPTKTSKPFVYVGRRTGHVMRSLDQSPPKHSQPWEVPQPDPGGLELGGKAVNSAYPTPPGSPTQLNKVERIGETLHILRPLIHLIGVGFFGEQSIVPWFASLITDASSHTLLSGHVKGKLKTSSRFNSDERKELRRRALIMAFYLLRSPIYDKYTKVRILKILQALSDHVPLVRYVLQPLSKYLPAWQQVYFYVWKE